MQLKLADKSTNDETQCSSDKADMTDAMDMGLVNGVNRPVEVLTPKLSL